MVSTDSVLSGRMAVSGQHCETLLRVKLHHAAAGGAWVGMCSSSSSSKLILPEHVAVLINRT